MGEDDSWFVPNFAEGFKGSRMQQGYDAEFRAVASGKPRPKVSWSHNGQPLSASEKFVMSYDPESGNISLLIRDLGPGDEGQYSCTVSNPYGGTTATLSVNPDASNKVGLNCYNPNSSRGTLQRQQIMRQKQLHGSISPDPATTPTSNQIQRQASNDLKGL